ncbi:MAG: primosomal protein N' [Clostridiales Family XIII bacterium]|nr:primosomal protein N' [Clostridiales Family XIII bacterium]
MGCVYANVVVGTKSDKVDNFFTYGVGDVEGIFVGAKVTVPFAQERGVRSGYVFELLDELPEELKGKRIRNLVRVDEAESLTEDAVTVCRWMRGRYYCRYIDAALCFAPSGKPSKSGKKRLPEAIDSAEKTEGSEEAPVSSEVLRNPLTAEQRKACAAILPAIENSAPEVFLLHGVTGSGKTEVYLAAAEACLAAGRGVVMLVPEISLTHQTVARFIQRFGRSRLAILHSKLTAGERYDEWRRIREGGADIVIGARSAVFAPFKDIGLFIVDEEHETSYKADQTPKYDAVEVAVKRARAMKAAVILGSATPSVVSSYRAEQGYYRKIRMAKRYNLAQMPRVEISDMRTELLKGNRSIFSEALYAQMEEELAAGRQVMLFLNRRGWSSYVSCPSCGYVMKCGQCNISLTYHKAENRAVCHYCGARARVPEVCPSCGKPGLRHFGLGTEQAEALTREAFPERRVARLDADAARKRGSGEKVLKDFAAGKLDILIGTQMIAKGLDFARVTLVGVLLADISLNIPDFKSPERTFQLLTQVAGRAGRREERGQVVVQTCLPDNYAIEAAVNGDYEGFYRTELYFRKMLGYPPFSDVVLVTAFAAAEGDAAAGAAKVKEMLIGLLGETARAEILVPGPAPIAKAGEDFRYHLYMKVPTAKRRAYERALAEVKHKINTANVSLYRIIIDVNPYSLM